MLFVSSHPPLFSPAAQASSKEFHSSLSIDMQLVHDDGHPHTAPPTRHQGHARNEPELDVDARPQEEAARAIEQLDHERQRSPLGIVGGRVLDDEAYV